MSVSATAAAPRARWVIQSVLAVAALPTATPCARLHARNVACEWGLVTWPTRLSWCIRTRDQRGPSLPRPRRPSPLLRRTGLACVHFRLATDGLAALVEVWDENARLPEPAKPSLADESGRGLMLVDALTERWGWELPQSGRGKIVWALVAS